MPFDRLIDLANPRIKSGGRWRIERDYQELEQELGLGHDEGRGWCGFHHHATLCIAAYAFLIAERAGLSPSAADKFATSGVPQNRPPEAPPVRPERHVASSIATVRRYLIVALATTLALCPCCNTPRKTTHATSVL